MVKSYITAIEESYQILSAAWNSSSSGAGAVLESITCEKWGYFPLLIYPGIPIDPGSSEIYAKAGYVAASSSKSSKGGSTAYSSTGRLGVQIHYPRNDEIYVRCARSLAVLVQGAFRTAESHWIHFSDERIMEVGWVYGSYQINALVTCKFDTDV
jgi:hypothetical protein